MKVTKDIIASITVSSVEQALILVIIICRDIQYWSVVLLFLSVSS